MTPSVPKDVAKLYPGRLNSPTRRRDKTNTTNVRWCRPPISFWVTQGTRHVGPAIFNNCILPRMKRMRVLFPNALCAFFFLEPQTCVKRARLSATDFRRKSCLVRVKSQTRNYYLKSGGDETAPRSNNKRGISVLYGEPPGELCSSINKSCGHDAFQDRTCSKRAGECCCSLCCARKTAKAA